MGQARNAILVTSADAVIAVGGSWGTLSEVALAMRLGRRAVSLGGWRILGANGDPIPGIHYTTTPEQAVAAALTPTRTAVTPAGQNRPQLPHFRVGPRPSREVR